MAKNPDAPTWEELCGTQNCGKLPCLADIDCDWNYKAYPRLYLQYNELVFDGFNTVNTASLSGENKLNTTPYPFARGSYYASTFHNGEILSGEQDLSLDISLPFVGLRRLQVLNYNDYIQYQLSKPGKIWAVDTGGKLIWAYAIPKHPPFNDYEIKKGRIVHMQMDFLLPEGYWHVADTNNVFFEPYNMCDFKDEVMSGCSHNCNAMQQCDDKDCKICCELGDDMSYCNTCWNPYTPCQSEYRIVYNCIKGEKVHGFHTWGTGFVSDHPHSVVGTVCSNAIYRSPAIITILGKVTNPSISFNDSYIKINGTYEGKLIIEPNGKVYHTPDVECGSDVRQAVPVSKIEFPNLETTLWAHRGTNMFSATWENDYVANIVYVAIDERTI